MFNKLFVISIFYNITFIIKNREMQVAVENWQPENKKALFYNTKTA